MTTNPNEKRFDCVEMMHRGAAKVQEELAGKSIEEQIEYWRRGTEELCERQAELRKERRHV